MKKIIRTIFVLVLSLVSLTLAACNDKGLGYTADDVIKVLLIEQEAYVTDDFDLPGVIKFKGAEYNITWTSNNSCLTVAAEKNENGNYTITVARPDEYQAVTLTAAVTVDGASASRAYEFSIYPVDVYEMSEAYKFKQSNKTVSEGFALESSWVLHGKTVEITWSVPTTSADKYTIAEGAVSFEPVAKNVPVSIVGTFSYGGQTTTMEYKFTLVPPTTVTSVKGGETYKYALYQATLGKNLYFAGKMDGKYLASTDKPAEAVDVTVVKVEGGFHLSFVDADGATKYLEIVSGSAAIVDTPTQVWSFNTEYYTFTQKGEDTDYYLGTYSSYATLSASKISYAATSYPLVLCDLTKMPETPVVETVTTIDGALAAEDGTPVELFGTVKSIDSEWNDKYSNMSIYLEDEAGNSILVYRLGTKVAVGDKIIISGTKSSYNGVAQIAQGATCTFIPKTIADAIAAEDGTPVELTGTVKSIKDAWNDKYGNMSIYLEDEAGKTILVYRLKTQVAVGDKVVISGYKGSYNGDAQVAQGATAEILEAAAQ